MPRRRAGTPSAQRPSMPSVVAAQALPASAQGNIMDRLSDPEEMQRLLRAKKQGSLLDETLADIIVRETLEARAVSKTLCFCTVS